MNRIVVYSKEGCPFCSLLKLELRKRDLPFEEVDVSDDALRQQFYERTGTRTVPQLYLADAGHSITDPSGERVGGWSEVSKNWDVFETRA